MTTTRTAKSNSFRLAKQAKTLRVHHDFLYTSLLLLYDYDVKIPNFTFCRRPEHKTMISHAIFKIHIIDTVLSVEFNFS